MLSLLSALVLSIVIASPTDQAPSPAPDAATIPPVTAPAVAAPATASPLAPSVANVGSSDIEAAGPQGPLRGSILVPEAPGAPVVIILPDAGQTDRDGNSARRGNIATYRLLADGLAGQGIATVRIDKRGTFASAGAVPHASEVSMVDYARDALAWVEAARARTGAPCAWLLGQGEGGLVALLAAQRGPNICGLVLVGTPARPTGEALKAALRESGAAPPLVEEAVAVLDTLAAGKRVDPRAVSPPVLALFPPETQRFMVSLLALKPADLITKITQPVLILQGERDAQTGASDARGLKAAKPDAALVILPNTNGALQASLSDTRNADLAAGKGGIVPLAPGVVDTIAQFILATR